MEAWVPPLAASLQDDSVVASFVFFSSLEVKIDETLVQIYTEETLLKGSSYSTHKEAKSKRWIRMQITNMKQKQTIWSDQHWNSNASQVYDESAE